MASFGGTPAGADTLYVRPSDDRTVARYDHTSQSWVTIGTSPSAKLFAGERGVVSISPDLRGLDGYVGGGQDWLRLGTWTNHDDQTAGVVMTEDALYRRPNDGSRIERYLAPGRWETVGGPATAIFGSAHGLAATNGAGELFVFRGKKIDWGDRVSGPAAAFAYTGAELYRLDAGGTDIAVYTGSGEVWASIGVPPAGKAVAICGGWYGLLATVPDGDVYQATGGQNWKRIGGPGSAFAPAATVVFAIKPDGMIDYFDQAGWHDLHVGAVQIAAGSLGGFQDWD